MATKEVKKGKEEAPTATTKVIFCGCTHEFQDKKYGPQKRVHNRGGKAGQWHWRCSVCNTKR